MNVKLLPLLLATLLFLPGVWMRLVAQEISPLFSVALYGMGFIGAALYLAWGTELAQLDLPAGVSVAILAFVAILPEYAVDLLFAYDAGRNPEMAPLALANMTGANRLLIGGGWSLVVLTGYFGSRKKRKRAENSSKAYALALSRRSTVDVVLLGLISLYTLNFGFRKSVSLWDTLILFSCFGFYAWRLSSAPREKPEFIGPPALICQFAPLWRRLSTLGLISVAGGVILFLARSFTESLITAGQAMGVSEFLMVQWIAPFATETAEIIPACIFAYRQRADQGLGTLLSAKINQWSLLVGGVPIAYALSTKALAGLPITVTQDQELLLTASQSVFAVGLLTDDIRLKAHEALMILGIFILDFAASVFVPDDQRFWVRYGFSGIYLLLALYYVFRARGHLSELFRNGLLVKISSLSKTPHEEVKE